METLKSPVIFDLLHLHGVRVNQGGVSQQGWYNIKSLVKAPHGEGGQK